MKATISGMCRRQQCANPILPELASERLCIEHFLDEAFARTGQALETCHCGHPIHKHTIEGLLSDALVVVKNLEAAADTPEPGQRDRMLELLLVLANVHEYVAGRPVPLNRLA